MIVSRAIKKVCFSINCVFHLLQAAQEFVYKIKFLDANEVASTVLFLLNQSPNCAINSILIEPIMGPI